MGKRDPCLTSGGEKKVGYQIKDNAISERDRLMREGAYLPYDAYLCPNCGLYHVGRRGFSLRQRERQQLYDGHLRHELGMRALAHVEVGDSMEQLRRRFRSAERKRRQAKEVRDE